MASFLSDSSGEEMDSESTSTRKLYCICKSSDIERFMIGCDHCNEWYHGDCIGVTQIAAKHIKSYICERCREIKPNLKIKYKNDMKPLFEDDHRKKHKHKKDKKKKKKHKSSDRDRPEPNLMPMEFSNTENIPEFGEEEDDKDTDGDPDFQIKSNMEPWPPVKEGSPSISPPARASRGRGRGKRTSTRGRGGGGPGRRKTARAKRDIQVPEVGEEPEYSDLDDDEEDDEPRQCYGSNCINHARSNSKYCSDECGITLASTRIKQFLGDRVASWNSSLSLVGIQAEKDLEEVDRQIIKAKQCLVDLEKEHEKLDEIVAKGKTLECLSDDEETEDSAEGPFPCLICAQDVGCKTALRHWERCFQKAESQMSFASIYQTKIEGRPLFCDFYNDRTQTYCKRLKVICPEHTKERRAENNEVCGAPLPETLLTDSDTLCRVPKKCCTKHYLWEKNRRAHTDVQRLRSWWHLDELFEKKRILQINKANRGSLINVLLNKTTDHQPDMPIREPKRVKKPVNFIP